MSDVTFYRLFKPVSKICKLEINLAAKRTTYYSFFFVSSRLGQKKKVAQKWPEQCTI